MPSCSNHKITHKEPLRVSNQQADGESWHNGSDRQTDGRECRDEIH